MITCNRCGTAYDDEATYCNVCNTALEKNSHYLVDQNERQEKHQISAQRAQQLTYTLGAIFVLFPFYATSRFFPAYIYGMQKTVWVVFVELMILVAILTIKRQHPYSVIFIGITTALLLPITPLGTAASVITFYLWLQTRNS